MNNTLVHFKKILLTTDFSKASLSAIPYALDEAHSAGSSVTLVNVVEGFAVPFVIGEFAPTPKLVEELRDIAIKSAEQQLADIVERHGSAALSSKVLHGLRSVADIVCDFANSEKFDLIIMASHGHGFFQRMLLGSVAERVLRQASCPVLIAPSESDKPLKRQRVFNKILVTSDFSEYSEATLPYARYEAKRNEATITMVHVVEPLMPPDLLTANQDVSFNLEIQNQYRETIERRLKQSSANLGSEGVSAELIERGYSVASSILEYAKSKKVDLIIIARRGAGGRVGLGGTVEKLVRNATCAVLVVPSSSNERTS